MLAQANIARTLAPMDDPIMQDFANALDEINQLAEKTEGFIWRMQDESGNSTNIKIFEDDMLLINMSVWKDADSLFEYTYKSDHVKFFRRKREWFDKLDSMHMVLWWVEHDKIPTPQEARERLDYLNEHGVTPYAFTFKQRFTVDEMLVYKPEAV